MKTFMKIFYQIIWIVAFIGCIASYFVGTLTSVVICNAFMLISLVGYRVESELENL